MFFKSKEIEELRSDVTKINEKISEILEQKEKQDKEVSLNIYQLNQRAKNLIEIVQESQEEILKLKDATKLNKQIADGLRSYYDETVRELAKRIYDLERDNDFLKRLIVSICGTNKTTNSNGGFDALRQLAKIEDRYGEDNV